jgi:hypothetical protein
MGLDYSRTNSGLVLAMDSMDSAAVERALKRKDPELRLQGWPDREHDCILWKVVRGLETVCVWQTDRGEPLPLSSGILDLVDKLDRNSRAAYVDADELNRRQKETEQRKWEADQENITEDWLMKHGRPILPRSQGLRRARDKRRARGENI